MTQVPTYDEFLALVKEVQELRREIAYLKQASIHWLTSQQACEALNCSRTTLFRLGKEAKITIRYEGRKTLYDAESIRDYIQSTCVSTDAATERVAAVYKSKGQRKPLT